MRMKIKKSEKKKKTKIKKLNSKITDIMKNIFYLPNLMNAYCRPTVSTTRSHLKIKEKKIDE
jgi:hypothetical protein